MKLSASVVALMSVILSLTFVQVVPAAHASGTCNIANVTLKHPDSVHAGDQIQTATRVTSDCFGGGYFIWVRVDLTDSHTSQVLSTYRYHWTAIYYPDVTTFTTPWILNNVTARTTLGFWSLTLRVYVMDTNNSAIQFTVEVRGNE
ncbi:MAG: hypothetical protein ABSD49_04750 [Candidatus Bathyarchaeia archaeon]|jgi:hypothetical protein